jgi:hypothetical protein
MSGGQRRGNDASSPLRRVTSRARVSWVLSLLCVTAMLVVGVGAGAVEAQPPGWSVVPSPNPSGGGGLQSISCPDSTLCTAVGQTYLSGGDTGTLIESWNGSTWLISSSPDVSGASQNLLYGVSCWGPARCVAVGQDGVGTTENPLIESWRGRAWSIPTSPQPGGTSGLNGVSCLTSATCIGVGFATSHLLAESSAGGTWHTLVNQQSGGAQSISCLSAYDCMTVGSDSIRSFGGSTWRRLPHPGPAGPVFLESVSCVSKTNCTLAGWYENGSDHTLIESWNGTAWSIVPSPNVAGEDVDSLLYGLSCLSATLCVAVGYSTAGGEYQPLVEGWNGSSWSIIPSADPTPSYLYGVSCTSSTSCTAVGYTQSGSTLIETGAPSAP